MKYFVVRLHQGCWLAPWAGDPGRTLVRDSARLYESQRSAGLALRRARQCRPFPNALIQRVGVTIGPAEVEP